jgi:hypothetical protein
MGAAPPPRSAFGRRFGQMAERQAGTVTLPRGSVVGAAVGASLLAVWAGVATWCVLQSDVLSASFLARHTAAERVYEDRIGALRARLDQVTSQKLVEQEGQESRFAQIAERQRQLENRHLSLARLLGEAGAPGSGARSEIARPGGLIRAGARPRRTTKSTWEAGPPDGGLGDANRRRHCAGR